MTIAHDQGMSQIAADLARRNAAAAQAAAGPAAGPSDGGKEEAGAELDVQARLALALGENTAEMRKLRAASGIPWEICHPIPLLPVANNAAGTINDERWEPREGWIWHITRISVQSNSTGGATSAVLVQDSGNVQGASNLQSFPPPGTTATAGSFLGCWEPKGKFLLAGQRLILVTTGGGAIMNGEAVEVNADWFARYLM